MNPYVSKPRLRAASVVIVVWLAGALSGCQCTTPTPPGDGDEPAGQAAGEPPAPLRAEATKLDIGQAPIRNPLNLYDVEIPGARDPDTAGTVDGVPVTMQDLEAQSVGAFRRISERIYEARDRGWRWLIERVALDRQAAAAGAPLIPFLLAEYGKLPAPPEADLVRVERQAGLASLSDDERRAAAISLWRMEAWQARRRELVLAGRGQLAFERVRRRISDPAYASPDTEVARLDGEPITRAELRALAGYQAALARHEYWRIAKLQFDKYADRFLIEREAEHLAVPAEELEAMEVERMPPVSDADVRAFIAENPEYEGAPDGFERARDNVRRLRAVGARQALIERLRAAADVRFLLQEPEFERAPVEVPGPRWHGAPDAPQVLVAFHAVGCATCQRGSRLLLSILEDRAGQIRLLAGDYFEPGQLDAYRGALALHCAPPQARDGLLARLTSSFEDARIETIARQAEAEGVEAAPFRACMESDRFLPIIVENLAMAERLGLERNVPGLFVNGVRIGDLKDLEAVLEQIDAALAAP